MGLFERKKAVSEPPEESWQIAKGELDGNLLLTRFNRGAKRLAGSQDLGIQIGVAIPFLRPDKDGMPDSEEAAKLADFEEALVEKAGDQATLVGVITTSGMREFVLYTGSGDWIETFHSELRSALPTHDVQVQAQTDPDWEVYRQFVPE
jgi:hypothetical protein